MLPGVTCHCYAAMLVNFPLALTGFGQQKSRINKDPAEFDWKCLLRLTSRGEHSRALMGGERAQEMNYICAHHAQETSIYFATHACKKTQSVVQPIPGPDRTRKNHQNGRARHQSHCGTANPNRFCCRNSQNAERQALLRATRLRICMSDSGFLREIRKIGNDAD